LRRKIRNVRRSRKGQSCWFPEKRIKRRDSELSKGQVRARLPPKSPLIELRDLVQKLGPAVDMDCFHFSRSVAPIILAT